MFHEGSSKKIEPLTFSLLQFMFENPDRVLSHDELISSVWKSPEISNSALFATVSAARRAIGDSAKSQHSIKTVSRSGYRFVAKVTCVNNEPDKQQRSTSLELVGSATEQVHNESPAGLQLPDNPSIAVMDFVDIGKSDIGSLAAQGLTVDINASLARLPHLFVIARASAANLLNLSSVEVGRRLGVRYLVYGNIQRSERRIQVTISVVDAIRNTEIWSEHFDRSIDDLFVVLNEITAGLVMTIDSTIEQAEIERALLVPTENLNAWESYHRGLWHIDRPTTEDVLSATRLFQHAIKLDPHFSRAYSGLSIIYTTGVFVSVAATVDDEMNHAFEYAQRSIDYSRRDSLGHWALGKALYLSGKHEQALDAFEQALRLNPSYSHAYLAKGVVQAHGELDNQALLSLDKGQRLNPLDPLLFASMSTRATSLANQKQYHEAVASSLLATDNPNAFFATYAVASACLELAGRSEEAQQYAAMTIELQPDYSVGIYQRRFPHTDEATRKPFIDAMQRSGLPGK